MYIRTIDRDMVATCFTRWVKTMRHAEVLVLPDTEQGICCFRFISGLQIMNITISAGFDTTSYCEPWSLHQSAFEQLLEGWDDTVQWLPHMIQIAGIDIPVLRFSAIPEDPSFSCDMILNPDECDFAFTSLYKFMDTDATNISRHSIMIARADKKLSMYATNGHMMAVFTYPSYKSQQEEDPFCLDVTAAKIVQTLIHTCDGGILCDRSDISLAFNRDTSKIRISGPQWSCIFTSLGRSSIRPSSVKVKLKNAISGIGTAALWITVLDDLRRMLHIAGLKSSIIRIHIMDQLCKIILLQTDLSFSEELPMYRETTTSGQLTVNPVYLATGMSIFRGTATVALDLETPLVYISTTYPSDIAVYISPIK